MKIANNFGFLFSPIGRICFLIFIGIICFSFKTLVGYIGGGCMCGNAIFNGYVLFKYPEVYEVNTMHAGGSTLDLPSSMLLLFVFVICFCYSVNSTHQSYRSL